MSVERLSPRRDARGLTQAEVTEAAGMTQSMIARLEAPSGPVPSLESIERHVNACGGQMALLISPAAAKSPGHRCEV